MFWYVFLFLCSVVVYGTCRIHCRVCLILSTAVIKHIHWQTCVERILRDEDTASADKKRTSKNGMQPASLSSFHRGSSPLTELSKSLSEDHYFLRGCGNLPVVSYLSGLPKTNNNPWVGGKVGHRIENQNKQDRKRKTKLKKPWMEASPASSLLFLSSLPLAFRDPHGAERLSAPHILAREPVTSAGPAHTFHPPSQWLVQE